MMKCWWRCNILHGIRFGSSPRLISAVCAVISTDKESELRVLIVSDVRLREMSSEVGIVIGTDEVDVYGLCKG